MKKPRAAFLVLLSVMSLATCSHPVAQAPQDPDRQAKIEHWLKKLKSEDADVRYGAVFALVELGAKERVKDIAELLEDENAAVRGAAVTALGKFGAKEYAKDIAELLKDKSCYVREVAVGALGELEAKERVKDIAELLEDEDADVRARAVNALEKLGAKEYASDIAGLLKDYNEAYIFKSRFGLGLPTTVSAEAERVLKEWGVDTEKLKSKNK